MTDVLVYWRDYKQNWIRQFVPNHAPCWHSNSKILESLSRGDQLWMVTSGANLRREPKQAGFLVAVLNVEKVMGNPDDDPAYPKEEYRCRVVVTDDGLLEEEDGIFVDEILRPEGKDKNVSIGRFLQGPRKLHGEKLEQLKKLVWPNDSGNVN